MTTSEHATPPQFQYHLDAYRFVLQALEFTQKRLGRRRKQPEETPESHVSGEELLFGFRDLAYQQFGGLSLTVFRHWGLQSTNDVGRIVWDLIERGNMRKTEQDRLEDFFDRYNFTDVFDRDYPVDVSRAFQD